MKWTRNENAAQTMYVYFLQFNNFLMLKNISPVQSRNLKRVFFFLNAFLLWKTFFILNMMKKNLFLYNNNNKVNDLKILFFLQRQYTIILLSQPSREHVQKEIMLSTSPDQKYISYNSKKTLPFLPRNLALKLTMNAF